ncbi:MAG: MMPL family transporter, partial [Proteobacteria bacterium]|nr:MMPL family transporter [Pseudomonadota bacterium]
MGDSPVSAVNLTDTHAGHRLLIRWVRLVSRSALPVLVVALLATLGAAYLTVTRIGINTDTTDMLSEELAFRRHNRALSQAFPQFTDNLTVIVEAATPDLAEDAAARLAAEIGARPRLFRDVFYAQGDAFFRRNGLLYLELDELDALGDRLAEIQPLLAALGQDPSLRGLSGVLRLALGDADVGPDSRRAEEAAAAVAPALEKLAAAAESLAARAPGGRPVLAMSWHALLSGEDPEPADKRRFIVLRPMLDFTSLEPAAQAIEALRRLAAELGLTEDNGLRVRLTGEAVMFQEELGSVRDGMGLAGLLSACLVFALLVLGLRSARLVGATLVTLVMGLIWTAAFATLAIGELNLISVAFAVLFIGLSVDFGIHFTLRYREAVEARAAPEANSGEANSGEANSGDADPGDALAEAARSVGGALALCAVAAAIGFFAFLPTAYRGVSELGLISGVGMFIALFANLTVLPAILSLMPLAPGGRVLHSPLGDPVQRLVARHPRRVIGGALALGIGAAALLPFAWFDDDPLNLRDPASESVATLLDLFDDPRVAPYSAKVLARDLAAGEALAARLEALPEVDSARVLSDFVPREQDDKLAIIEEMGVFLAPVFDAAGSVPAPGPAPGPEDNRRALRDLRASLETASLEIAGGALAGGARRLAAA